MKSYNKSRQHIKKQRHYITLPTNVHLVKAMVFPIVIHRCESLTIKKAEHQRIDAFELWCWRRLLRVPWRAGRSKQSILKEISLEYSLEGLMLKLKLQYFEHLMWRTDSCEKTLMLEKTECSRRRGWQSKRWLFASWTRCTWIWASSGSWWRMGSMVCCSPWGCKKSDTIEWLTWTESD